MVIRMPDTLKGFSDFMADLPDNTAGLITPQSLREAILSDTADRGAAYGDGGPWTVTNPGVDQWFSIPLAIQGDMNLSPASLFWSMDANGRLFYDYATYYPNVVVPPGLIRAVRVVGVIGFDAQSDVWEFGVNVGGVVQSPTVKIDTASTTDNTQAIVSVGDGLDVSSATPVTIVARNTSDSTDLELHSFSYRVVGGALA